MRRSLLLFVLVLSLGCSAENAAPGSQLLATGSAPASVIAPTTATTPQSPTNTLATFRPTVAPSITPSTIPTNAPTVAATTRPVTTAPITNLCGAPSNPWNYNFCSGSFITSPPSNFCSYFKCIATFWSGRGYVMQCADGTFGKSGGISGSCSGHGGNRRALYSP